MKAKTFHGGADEERSKILRRVRKDLKQANESKEDYAVVVLEMLADFIKGRSTRSKKRPGGL